MANKAIYHVVKALEEQGCRIRETKGGWFVYCPDGKTTLGFHKSNASDRRTMKNLKSDIQRAGLRWPRGVPA